MFIDYFELNVHKISLIHKITFTMLQKTYVAPMKNEYAYN